MKDIFYFEFEKRRELMTPDSRINGQALAEISPLQKPKLELEKIVTNLSNPKTHWETMIESLVNLRALAAFHQVRL